jgi:hypothetical protein
VAVDIRRCCRFSALFQCAGSDRSIVSNCQRRKSLIAQGHCRGVQISPGTGHFVILTPERTSQAVRRLPNGRSRRVTGGLNQFSLRSELATATLKLVPDGGERGIELGADRLDGGDDHDRNAGGDQAVLDRSGTRLVLQKCKRFGHVSFSIWLQTGLPETGITYTGDGSKGTVAPLRRRFSGTRKNAMKLIRILLKFVVS